MDRRAVILAEACNRYGTAVLSANTIIALIVYPLPFCIDCEYPNPWGHVAVTAEIPVSFWLLIAPFLAGVFLVKRGWLVPLTTVLALLATQSLGGVAWWSLRENEGPFILLLGLPVTALCYATGRLIRVIATSVRRKARDADPVR